MGELNWQQGRRTASLVYPLPLASRNLQAITLHVCGNNGIKSCQDEE